MGSGLDDYWDKHIRQNNIPPEFSGEPIECITGKKYQQLEFDFGEKREPKSDQYKDELWKLKNNVGNYILQAKAVIDTVMSDMGSNGSHDDTHEFALWGASELLQNASDLLE